MMKKETKIQKKTRKRQIAQIKRQIKDYWSRFKETKNFYSHHYFGEGHTWADVYFVGKFKGLNVVWNCVIQTAGYLFEDAVSSKAWEISDKYPNHFLRKEDGMFEFEKEKVKLSGGGYGYTMKVNPEWTDEVEEKFTKELAEVSKKAAADGIKVEIKIEVLTDYEFGIGLIITIKDKYLTLDVIEKTIAEFNRLNVDKFGTIRSEEITMAEQDFKMMDPSEPLKL